MSLSFDFTYSTIFGVLPCKSFWFDDEELVGKREKKTHVFSVKRYQWKQDRLGFLEILTLLAVEPWIGLSLPLYAQRV